MGFFSFFKKQDEFSQEAKNDADLELYAPVSGTIITLEDVPDLVISEKLIGDGIAFIPGSDSIVAPCDGTITRLIASNNAFAIRSENGIEIYVTYGIGTDSFTGKGLRSHVKIGDKVRMGDRIISINAEEATQSLESNVTSMIAIKTSADIAKVIVSSGKCVAGKSPCAWVILKSNKEAE